MSKETTEWLNQNVLIGFTDKRGTAWHYAADAQGSEPNHYPLAVPVADVVRRLFDFTVVSEPLYIADGMGGYKEVPGRIANVTSDTRDVLGIFKDSYNGHGYKEWLLEVAASIMDSSLSDIAVGSAGLLANRARAWVQFELPDSIQTPEGIEFRPNILATTSFDGTIASTYKRTQTLVVCDNTREMALGEAGQSYKVKHSRYSEAKIPEAREALAMIFADSESFAAEIKALCEWEVSNKDFDKHLDVMVPLPEPQSKEKVGRAWTMAENKRDSIIDLYAQDERVAPWAGTAFGVLQAYNTYEHHVAIRRGDASRFDRNREYAINGKMAAHDARCIAELAKVTGRLLVNA